MASLVNSDISRLVARLVLGYLDEQNLSDAYNVFCESSRHLTKEYEAYKEGTKSIDTSIGLVNIITEYFLLKEKLNEFVRTCPRSKLIIQLIDTSSIQLRLELIFKVLKDNLLKFDEQIEEETVSRKRRKNEGEFDISQTNTSTPETSHQPSLKRRRISLTTPFIALSANNSNNKSITNKSALNRKELNYLSSPETSNKEDDVTEEEPIPTKITPPPPELLSETILGKPDFLENFAEIINKTRSTKETESTEASTSHVLTQTDVQDILSKTERENDFEDILKEVIDKFLDPTNEKNEGDEEKKASDVEEKVKAKEIPIKQRLRPRSTKKVPANCKKAKNKINIISNEVYTGPLPSMCVNLSSNSTTLTQPPVIEQPPPIYVSLVPIMPPQTLIPIQTITSSSTFQVIQESNDNINSINNINIENAEIITIEDDAEIPPAVDLDKENKPQEKTQQPQTPKVPVHSSFLESKCKSTPRRKATHVRILDFNHTPRLATLKEFSTPVSGIKMDTPGSAPASINVTKENIKSNTQAIKVTESIEIVDDSSNSTSISNTPKVAKNRRRRKIEIDTKKTDETPSKDPPPMTREQWDEMRARQKRLSVDDMVRMAISQQEIEKHPGKKVKKKKTPKKRNSKNAEKIPGTKQQTTSNGQNPKKPTASGAKFKVTSPRKAALLRKTPKKKLSKSPIVNKSPEKPQSVLKSPIVSVMNLLTPNIDVIKQQKQPEVAVERKEVFTDNNNSDLNRSASIQEVAAFLTHLPEIILPKTLSGNLDEQNKIDPNLLMETPLKLDSNMSPLPNTPRFAVPLIATSNHETPMPKAIITTTTATSTTITSLVKHCDILTPNFAITPGFKETPLKSDQSPQSASGYSSRRTDYSSCSSYYKPDESEEINRNIESIIKKNRERNSISESDGGGAISNVEESVRIPSAKKIEVPGALERVHSFTDDKKKEIPVPHYTMMDEEGLLSESMVTTASDSDSSDSSTFTCSTCSTDPSTDENATVEMLNQSDIPEDDEHDEEWHRCKKVNEEEKNNSLVDEKTCEVRFPLRNLMTPRKIDQEIKTIIEEVATVETKVSATEVKNKFATDLEAVKQRTLRIIKSESNVTTKIKKSNAKSFKLPAEQPKVIPKTRREQILSQNLSNRTRPTPLQLNPSTSSSSSRRKNATPRKTIVIDDLPKVPSPVKKNLKKVKKSPSTKPEKISLENITDNAVMHDDHPSLNISSSFNEDDEGEEEETVIKKITSIEEGSNTFQKAMIQQGFDKKEVIELEKKLEDEKEEGEMSDSEEDEEEELTHVFSSDLSKNIFTFKESGKEIKNKFYDPLTKYPPSKCNVDGNVINLDFSLEMDLFAMKPTKASDKSNNGKDKRKDEKGKSNSSKPKLKESKKNEKSTESKIAVNDMNIDNILTMIHGK